MGLLLVEHNIAEPALYGAAAAAVASARQCRMMHLPARFDTGQHADAVQHVVAAGGLAASGLCWFERLNGQPVSSAATVDDIVAAAKQAEVVVPVHPRFVDTPELVRLLTRSAADSGIRVEVVHIERDGNALRDRGTGLPIAWRDSFGRITAFDRSSVGGQTSLQIGLIGSESDHRDVYPAALASLADAADALSVDLDIRFVDPMSLAGPNDCAELQTLSGILLPGGAAMKNVPGQIEAAAASLASGLPTVGLCLGMQTMATAIAWRAFGRGTANLAEADPDAAIKTFVPLEGQSGPDGESLPDHRTGEWMTRVVDGTQLSLILPMTTPVRYNHRFRLDPQLLPALRQAGMQVSAEGFGGAIVDAIEDRDHPFFIGMQGHPELSSSDRKPHALLTAFLVAAREHKPRTE